jgi:NDP-sugar pyrophosphorylase family protein
VKAQSERRRKTVKLSNITVVILAGGMGTRLHSAVPNKHKVLAEIQKQPFIIFLLDQLVSSGARDVVLCTGHMAEQVHEKLGETYRSLKLEYSQEEVPLGTGGAVRLALPLIKSEIVMIMNGDSYVNADLNAFLEWFLRKDLAAALILTKVHDTSRYGRVMSAEDGRIQAFEEKSENEGYGWINAGIYLLKKKLMKTIPSGKTYSLEREFFPLLIGKGLCGYRCAREFIDIGTPESYAQAEAFFKAKMKDQDQ